ncbi:MAG: protein kinase [Oscillospiraceae bacterium]
MPVNIEFFIEQKYDRLHFSEALRTEPLYNGFCSSNKRFEKILAIMHQELNSLFQFMYSKLRTNAHYNAAESRALLEYIKLYEDMNYVLKETKYAFEINDDYKQLIDCSHTFLQESGGSPIPRDLPQIELLDYEPIFTMRQSISIPAPSTTEARRYQIKLIGEGSYALVFKYKDDFYHKNFVIKRAKRELTSKELERFRREYEVMRELNSPYILEVYQYDEAKNEYYAEYADETLYKFITHHSDLELSKRKSISYQIFKGLSYVHSKGYLHRDLSLTNILLVHYDDGNCIVKLSDFGLVKEPDSTLTSLDSEIKGSLNDSNLRVVGFSNFSIVYETYALTRVILFVMTGLQNIERIRDEKIKRFVLKGLAPDTRNRYQSVDELKAAFNDTF